MSALPSIVRSAIATGARGVSRGLLRDVEQGNIGISQMQYLITLARLYARFGSVSRERRRRDDKIPIQVYGSNNLPEHQSHILDSMTGRGSNRHPTKALLHRGSRQSRYFLKRNDACGNTPRGILACDEYPYNTSIEGGKNNFIRGKVSVRLISKSESSIQGGFMSSFYTGAEIGLRDAFIVVPFGGTSGYFDKSWNWHQVPKN